MYACPWPQGLLEVDADAARLHSLHAINAEDTFKSIWQARENAINLAEDVGSPLTQCTDTFSLPLRSRAVDRKVRFSDEVQLHIAVDGHHNDCSILPVGHASLRDWPSKPWRLRRSSSSSQPLSRSTWTPEQIGDSLESDPSRDLDDPHMLPPDFPGDQHPDRARSHHPGQERPPWFGELWDLLQAEGTRAEDDDGLVIFLDSFYIHHEHHCFHAEARPLRFGVQHEDWEPGIRLVWEDLIDPLTDFSVIWVRPDPPFTQFPGTVGTVIVQQGVLPDRVACLTSALLPFSPDFRKIVAAHSTELILHRQQIITLAGVEVACQHRLQAGFGDCTIHIGVPVVPHAQIQITPGLGLTIRVPAPLSDSEVDHNLFLRIQRDARAPEAADRPESHHPPGDADGTEPEDVVSMMGRRPVAVFPGTSSYPSSSQTASSSDDSDRQSDDHDWKQTVLFTLSGSSHSALLPWDDHAAMRIHIAHTLQIQASSLLDHHVVKDLPDDLESLDLRCVLPQLLQEPRPSVFQCLVLMDVEVYEENDIQPSAFRRYARWMPTVINWISVFRLLGFESHCVRREHQCRLWHNNRLIDPSQSAPLRLSDGDYTKIFIGDPSCGFQDLSHLELSDDPDGTSMLQFPVIHHKLDQPDVRDPPSFEACRDAAEAPMAWIRHHGTQDTFHLRNDPLWDLWNRPRLRTRGLENEEVMLFDTWFLSSLGFPRCSVSRAVALDEDTDAWVPKIRHVGVIVFPRIFMRLSFASLLHFNDLDFLCSLGEYRCEAFVGDQLFEENEAWPIYHGMHLEVVVATGPASSSSAALDVDPPHPGQQERASFRFDAGARHFDPALPDLTTMSQFVQDLHVQWASQASIWEDESPTADVLSWFVDHSDPARRACTQPRPVRLDHLYPLWEDVIRHAWRDQLAENQPMRIFLVRPQPPSFGAPLPHVLLVQNPHEALSSSILTVLDFADPAPTIRVQAAITTLAIVQLDHLLRGLSLFDRCLGPHGDLSCLAWHDQTAITLQSPLAGVSGLSIIVEIRPRATEVTDDSTALLQTQFAFRGRQRLTHGQVAHTRGLSDPPSPSNQTRVLCLSDHLVENLVRTTVIKLIPGHDNLQLPTYIEISGTSPANVGIPIVSTSPTAAIASGGPVSTSRQAPPFMQSIGSQAQPIMTVPQPMPAGPAVTSSSGVFVPSGVAAGTAPPVVGPKGANIFVYNIPTDWSDDDFNRSFSLFGTIVSAKIHVDPVTQAASGYCSYTKKEAATMAIRAMNGLDTKHGKLGVAIRQGEEQYNADGLYWQHNPAHARAALGANELIDALNNLQHEIDACAGWASLEAQRTRAKVDAKVDELWWYLEACQPFGEQDAEIPGHDNLQLPTCIEISGTLSDETLAQEMHLWGHRGPVFEFNGHDKAVVFAENFAPAGVIHYMFCNEDFSDSQGAFLHSSRIALDEHALMKFLYSVGYWRAVIVKHDLLRDWFHRITFANPQVTVTTSSKEPRLPSPWPVPQASLHCFSDPYWASDLPRELPVHHVSLGLSPLDFESLFTSHVDLLNHEDDLFDFPAETRQALMACDHTIPLEQLDRLIIYCDGSSPNTHKHVSPLRAEEEGGGDSWAYVVLGERYNPPGLRCLGWTAQPTLHDESANGFIGSDRVGADLAEKEALAWAALWRLSLNSKIATCFRSDSQTALSQAGGASGCHCAPVLFGFLRGAFQALESILPGDQLMLDHVRGHTGEGWNEMCD
eukprot:s2688_g8.t1